MGAELSPPDPRQALTIKMRRAFWLGTHRGASVRHSCDYFLISAFLWARVWVVISRLGPFGPWAILRLSVATNSLTSVGWDLSKLSFTKTILTMLKLNNTNPSQPRPCFGQDFWLAWDLCTFTSCCTCIWWENRTREAICMLISANTTTKNLCFSHWSKYIV